MNIDFQKLNPWNWFQSEEKEKKAKNAPLGFNERQSANMPDLPGVSRTGNRPLFQMQKQFDDLMEKMVQQINSGYSLFKDNDDNPLFKPEVDVYESSNNYTIEIDLPGVEEKDISLKVVDKALLIEGSKSIKREKEDEDNGYHKIERSHGSFRRVLDLPDNANEENVQAEFKDGVLKVEIDKKQESEPQKRGKEVPIKKAA